jgi:hypothetical protein
MLPLLQADMSKHNANHSFVTFVLYIISRDRPQPPELLCPSQAPSEAVLVA